jgi:hypothetical protein
MNPRPHAASDLALVLVLGSIAAVYLAVGGVLVWAYTAAVGSGGYRIRWERLPVTALWLVPGALLGASTVFVRRRHAWAFLTSAALLLLPLPVVVLRLCLYLVRAAQPRFWGRGWLLLLFYAGGLALLVAGLALLRRHLRRPRSGPVSPGPAGFDLT